MNTRTYLGMFLIVTSIAMGTTFVTTQALADKSSASNGLDKADENVHENTPEEFAGKQDLKFHEGTCQGEHPVDIEDGCDNALITDPGESDDNRQDNK